MFHPFSYDKSVATPKKKGRNVTLSHPKGVGSRTILYHLSGANQICPKNSDGKSKGPNPQEIAGHIKGSLTSSP